MLKKAIKAYISIGTNQGARVENMMQAVAEISCFARLTGVSSLYCTAPLGYLAQEDFLNAIIEIETSLEPLDLLAKLQAIENKMGRKRTIRWGPRIIDLDIILYGGEEISTAQLQVPHPRAGERAFVLVPLAELNPRALVGEAPVKDLIQRITNQKISLFKQTWFDKLNLGQYRL
ncbi:MAG TPA: 2-amino-4-hydroxy-6-hydroxymethyldihydropteridine diphosphokinase [Verrucomicrobiae bacterium]|nr:2-amino-4-hydroxy-6-hydroxymethyldihydropteridine diphosphokinase [Verrucomicrobiae bacterium]